MKILDHIQPYVYISLQYSTTLEAKLQAIHYLENVVLPRGKPYATIMDLRGNEHKIDKAVTAEWTAYNERTKERTKELAIAAVVLNDSSVMRALSNMAIFFIKLPVETKLLDDIASAVEWIERFAEKK